MTGDPMSPILFLIAFQPILDMLVRHLDYYADLCAHSPHYVPPSVPFEARLRTLRELFKDNAGDPRRLARQ